MSSSNLGSSSPNDNSFDYKLSRAQHHQTQERSLRCPSPPKLWIPPPQVNDNGDPDFSFLVGPDFMYNGLQNCEFLNSVSFREFRRRDVGRDWKYEERRQAQEILPYMFLGPDAAARDRKFLTEKKISLCMSVRNTLTAKANLLNPRAPRDLGIPLINIDVASSSELISAFPRAITVINEHLNTRYLQDIVSGALDIRYGTPSGNVLVFCETGNERSAAVVAAYAMAVYCLDVTRAVQLVQGSRFCVALDYHMGHLLGSYQTILEAQRDVYGASTQVSCADGGNGTLPSTGGGVVNSWQGKKRGLEETRDEDEKMEDVTDMVMDVERFENRESLAPFADGFLPTSLGNTDGR